MAAHIYYTGVSRSRCKGTLTATVSQLLIIMQFPNFSVYGNVIGVTQPWVAKKKDSIRVKPVISFSHGQIVSSKTQSMAKLCFL